MEREAEGKWGERGDVRRKGRSEKGREGKLRRRERRGNNGDERGEGKMRR